MRGWRWFASICALAPSLGALAQPYPAGTVRLVIPFAAGSATDVYARLVGRHLSDALGQPVVVEARPGANGSIAAQQVAKSKPDGLTLFFTTNTTHAANPSLMKQMTYDPVKDFDPVTKIGGIAFFMAVNGSSPYKSVPDLVDAAKAQPGRISYGSGNSLGILAPAALQKITGTQMTHVPYKSTPQALVDVLGGQVTFLFVDLSVSRPHTQSGRARLLAVATLNRSPLAPEIPSMDELGYKGFDIPGWSRMRAYSLSEARTYDRPRSISAMNSPIILLTSSGRSVAGKCPACGSDTNLDPGIFACSSRSTGGGFRTSSAPRISSKGVRSDSIRSRTSKP